MAEDREVLAEVWAGRVPAVFSLAEEDWRGEGPPPDPCCLMLPRMSYLPLATDKVRSHFSPSLSQPGEMWLSYRDLPLRWHHPIGLLYDLLATGGPSSCPPDSTSCPLPWTLTAHFSSFPLDNLLPCPSREAVESVFMSSLKESDQLKHNGKVMKQMQKKDHNQLWLGLVSDKFDQFWAINRRLMEPSGGEENFRHIPIRLYTGDNCSIVQRLVSPGTEESPRTLGSLQEELGLQEATLLIQGIQPSPDTPLQWLARHLAYPDNFLHVAVVQQGQ